MSKMDKDGYYMRLAAVAAMRGTCDRRQVGAVVVAGDRVLSTGFNGAPAGMPECDSVGHLMANGHCIRTIHAEANALLEAGASAIRAALRDKLVPTLYTTTWPCMWCMKLAINAGIRRIVYGDDYRAPEHHQDEMEYARVAARECGIKMDRFSLGDIGFATSSEGTVVPR